MGKFKAGDRVFFTDTKTSDYWHSVNKDWGNASVKLGTVVLQDGHLFVRFDDYKYLLGHDLHSFSEGNYDFADVYESPLYEALR